MRLWWRTAPIDRGWRQPTIHDVPCLSCQQGYSTPHACDIPDYCPCDQAQLHVASDEEVGLDGGFPLQRGVTEMPKPISRAALSTELRRLADDDALMRETELRVSVVWGGTARPRSYVRALAAALRDESGQP